MTTAVPRCQCRRKAETSLSCSRCSAPICPDCSVVATVGMICRSCARGSKNPLHQIAPGRFVLASIACLAASLLGGWLFLSLSFGIGFISLWAAYLFGLGIGEIALRLTGRKRGLVMEILAGSSVVLGMIGGFGIELLLHAGKTHLPLPLIALSILAAASAVWRVRNI